MSESSKARMGGRDGCRGDGEERGRRTRSEGVLVEGEGSIDGREGRGAVQMGGRD